MRHTAWSKIVLCGSLFILGCGNPTAAEKSDPANPSNIAKQMEEQGGTGASSDPGDTSAPGASSETKNP